MRPGSRGLGTPPYGAYRSVSRGVGVGAPVGHYTAYRSTAAVRTQAGYVRIGFRGYGCFTRAGTPPFPARSA
jgi:hypothetical protein